MGEKVALAAAKGPTQTWSRTGCARPGAVRPSIPRCQREGGRAGRAQRSSAAGDRAGQRLLERALARLQEEVVNVFTLLAPRAGLACAVRRVIFTKTVFFMTVALKLCGQQRLFFNH